MGELQQNRRACVLTSSYDSNADHLIARLGSKKKKLDLKQPSLSINLSMVLSVITLGQCFLIEVIRVLRESTGKLAVPLLHTYFFKNSFSYKGAALWNSLTVKLRQVQ